MVSISQIIQHRGPLNFLCSTAAFVLMLVALTDSIGAESGTRKQSDQSAAITGAGQRIYAEPIMVGENPYLLGSRTRLKLPVAANGYSVVALRDQQKWQAGKSFHQAIFDGQLYWFNTERERNIFAAAPDRYAPVLGGDCVVSFAETTRRIHGDPHFGVVHRDRIYFFASEREQEQFKMNADHYAQADIGNEGNCLVSRIDQQKQIQGLPATVAIVGGLRYYFAGIHQRAIFGADPSRYGVKLSNLAQQFDAGASAGQASPHSSSAGPSNAQPQMDSEQKTKNQQALANAKPLNSEASSEEAGDEPTISEAIPADKLAMEGYCPISIREQGIWVEGILEFQVEHAGKIYLLAGKSQQEKFQKDPQPYLPELGGNCLVSLIDKGQRVAGSVFHSALVKDKDKAQKQIYLFAGPEEQRAFNANSAAYLEAAKAETTSDQYNDEEEEKEATAKTGTTN